MHYLTRHFGEVASLTAQHLLLTGVSLAIALTVAVPAGVLIAKRRSLGTPVLAFLGFLYTIPSLAAFGLLVPFEGLGFWTAVTALAAYAQLILVRNIAAGIVGVEPAVVEAARGVGMSDWQVFWTIERPLAMPVALGGVRLAAVSLIGIATIAALIDAGGLGMLIFAGIQQYNVQKAVAGASAAAVLALAAEFGLRAVERAYRRRVFG
ncbi:MAG: ABC transporter permease [Candidatus Eremiobacteraeota bacterium]|nr:ABC transporter permease [Candidatus Eremiobacteraeota bacterium]MBC5827588.1 ABC transporter permease [Candidatus Eremiobacteraeota bacterium]